MKNILLIVTISLIVIGSGCSDKSESNPQAEKEAVKAAEEWVGLVDEAKYGQSWEQAAEIFKKAVAKNKWEQTIQGLRPSFGKLISSEIKSTTYKTSLPGAQDGEYVIVQFKTKFENKANAIETITPMKDKDGVWRASGYYIK